MEQENIAIKYDYKNPRNVLIFAALILLGAIIIVSILREKIVRPSEDITTVLGRGSVSYQPDTAVITLGARIDRAPKAETALNMLNDSMNKIIASAAALGVPAEDIETQAYSLYPHYDFQISGGRNAVPSGYDANQQAAIKARGIDKNRDMVGKIIEEAGKAGANQVVGVTFEVSNLEELKQQARIEAISDARSRSAGLAKAAGVRSMGRVVSWYENIIKAPDVQTPLYGIGGEGAEKSASSSPQVSGGTQEIIIEMGLNYRIK